MDDLTNFPTVFFQEADLQFLKFSETVKPNYTKFDENMDHLSALPDFVSQFRNADDLYRLESESMANFG